MKYSKLIALLSVLPLGSCGYSQAEFVARGDTIEMRGVIDAETPELLSTTLMSSPSAKNLQLVSVPGSVDDDSSLEALHTVIRQADLVTVVPSDGLVASGGTDLFLMGRRREIQPGACVGVHTWTAGIFGVGVQTGASLPRESEEHGLYLEFYEQIGIDQEFYWFTLAAADTEDMHWMSPDEINRFNLSTTRVASDGLSAAERSQRCWDRVE